MLAWDNIEVDVGGDETGNFGPRLETGSALYQVDTHATISTTELQPSCVPRVCAYACEDSLCVLTNDSLLLLNESCHKIHANVLFELTVDCVTSDETGAFIAIGERSGTLRLLDATTQQPLFAKTLLNCPDAAEATFRHLGFTPLSPEGACQLCVVTRDSVFLFSNIRLEQLLQAVEERNGESAQALLREMRTAQLPMAEVHDEGCTYATMAGSEAVITAGGGENVLCLWERDWLSGRFEPTALVPAALTRGAAVSKCFVTPCNRLVLTLDDQGCLCLWDVHTMLRLKSWAGQHTVRDFLLLRAGDSNTEKVSAVLLTGEEGHSCLQVCSLPGLAPVYTLQLAPVVFLAACPTNQESILLLEGVNDSDPTSAAHRIHTLRVRALSEAHPETRFSRLLQKKLFTEAEEFARLYNLDIESVYKVKIIHMLDELSYWNEPCRGDHPVASGDRAVASGDADSEALLSELRACLERVSDDACVAECCLRATLPTFQTTLELLHLAKDRLSRKPASSGDVSGPEGQDAGAAREALLLEVMETLQKMATFQVAFGTDAFTGAKWEWFLKANLWVEFVRSLAKADVSVAFTLWRRHQSEFEESFSEAHLDDVLNSIPESARSRDLSAWLQRDLIPFVIRVFPEGLGQIAGWLEQRALNMEVTEKEDWPENALAVCELLRTTCASASQAASERGLYTPHHFATQICNLSVAHSQLLNTQDGDETALPSDASPSNNPFLRLHTLVQHLTHLVSLHRKYNCRLSLAEYVQETVESLTYRMLDRVVAVELIPDAIARVVRPYMKEHNLSPDKMLYQYIGDLVSHSGRILSVTGEAPWESKAIAVIECINNPQYKIGGILVAMKCAYIPWSADMDALIKQGLKLNHPKVAELEKQCQLAELSQMLAGYDLRHFTVNESNAETLVYYLLKQDRPSALADALLVVRVVSALTPTTAHVFRLRFLLENERLAEALDFLSSLDAGEALVCCSRFLQLTLVTIDNTCVFQQRQLDRKRVYTGAACDLLPFMVQHATDALEREEWAELRDRLLRIHALQVEFGEYVRFSDYTSTDYRATLLRKFVTLYFTGCERLDAALPQQPADPDRKPPRGQGWTLNKLYRLASLLEWDLARFKGFLAVCAVEAAQLGQAVKLAREVFSHSQTADTASVLYRVAHNLSLHLASGKISPDDEKQLPQGETWPQLISDLAAHAATYCHPSLLLDCVELSRCSQLAESVARQCESGDYGVSLQRAAVGVQKQDVYKEWCFEPQFREDGLVMEAEQAVPIAYQFSIACLPPQQSIQGPDRGLLTSTRVASGKTKASEEEEEETADSPASATAEVIGTAGRIVAYLKENSQLTLALQYSVRAMAVCVQNQLVEHITGPSPQEQEAGLKAHLERIKPVLAGSMKTAADITTLHMQKVFNASPLDSTLALGFVCTVAGVSKQSAFDQLRRIEKAMANNYKKVLALASVGVQFAELCRDTQLRAVYDELSVNAAWGKRLAKIKVNFKSAFNKPSTAKDELLPEIVRCEGVDVATLREYCSAFGLCVDRALLLYLRHLLVPRSDVSARDQAGSGFARRARHVLAAMTVDDDMPDKLKALVSQIDSYEYARLEFVLCALVRVTGGADSMADRGLQVLRCIQSYKRVSPPSEYELNYRAVTEEQQMMASGRLSALAHTRMPFHPLMEGDPWKIITPELNADTVDLWLRVANVLQLQRDLLNISAVKNIISAHVTRSRHGNQGELASPVAQNACAQASAAAAAAPTVAEKSECNWDGADGVDRPLFETLMTLLLRLHKCELAVTCAGWVVKELPMGAEKVFALKKLVTLANRWLQTATADEEKQRAEEASRRFTAMCRCLSTEQLLFQHGLGDPELVDLAPKASRLIMRLYEHESIPRRVARTAAKSALPDIHEVANQIAAINGLSVHKIRQTLMQKWLPPSQQRGEEADTTVNETLTPAALEHTLRSEDEVSEDEVNLQRAIYLQQQGDLTANAQFLISFIKQPDSQVSHTCRVRAMRCLFALVDKHTIASLTAQPVDKIKETLEVLLYVTELERLHFPHTPQSFSKCNKAGLVRGIWRNHSHHFRAVRLVSDLCLDYGICDIQLWDSILQQLFAFNMMSYLRHVLVCLSGLPALWRVSSVQRMWRSVLLAPLTAAVAPLTDQQVHDCYSTLTLLHRCPVLLELDVAQLARQLYQLEVLELTLSCTMLVPDPTARAKLLQLQLGEAEHVTLLGRVEEWRARGEALPMEAQMKSAIFDHIVCGDLYACVDKTVYARPLVLHMIQTHTLHRLLLHQVKAGRLQEASACVSLQLQMQPESALSRLIKLRAAKPLDSVKIYLQERRVLGEVEYLFPAPSTPTRSPPLPAGHINFSMDESNVEYD